MNVKNANKWTVLASFKQWVHLLRNRKMDQADAILEGLVLHQSFAKEENLLLYIPDDVRSEILRKNMENASGFGHWRFDPKRVHNTKRLLQMQELLQEPHRVSQLALLRVLRLEGQVDEAILTVENWLRKGDSRQFTVGLATEYGWMMREKGTPSRALPEINRLLLDKSDVHRWRVPALLIERARLHAAMNEWDVAKNDLEEFFRIPSQEQKVNPYRNWSDACLILGLLRQQRGDQTGALEAWRKGKYKDDPNNLFWGDWTQGTVLTNVLILDSLCQDLAEKRTEAIFRNLMRDRPGIDTMLKVLDTKNLFRSATAILTRMWHTPKGKEAARKMVLRTCSFQEYVRLPLQVFAAEMVRAETIGDKFTAEQEKLVWTLSEDAFVAFTTGKIDELKGMQLALLWKRGPSLLGGIEVIKGLDPKLRGAAAYFMGLRFQRMGRPSEDLFRIALDNAPANSTLQRLTRIELDKMRKSK